eukprot:1320213-Amphidinium_carterae.1
MDAKRGTIGNTKLEAWGEEGETASLSTVCLQADLSSSTMTFPRRRWNKWVVLKVKARLRLRGKNMEFYLQSAKHFDEVDQDVTSHEASHPKWISRAKLRWWKTKSLTGRKRARRVRSGSRYPVHLAQS